MTTEIQEYRPPAPPDVVEPPGAMTASQARVDAVSKLLSSAYVRASMLTLTPEESEELTAEFPDEAVRSGARGDVNLLYIEHAYVRERLMSVFGPGQWTIVNRRSWMDDATGWLYADVVLICRGCFVGECIGAMRYSARNSRINYADAIKGAESDALGRIAGTALGVGLQLWKAGWCEGWKQRQRGPAHGRPAPAPPAATPAAKALVKDDKLAKAKTSDVLPKTATDATRKWMLKQLATVCGFSVELLHDYAQARGWISAGADLDEWPLDQVPTGKGALTVLAHAIESFRDGDAAAEAAPAEDETWRAYKVPFGKNMGVPLEELDKKTLFGWWANFEVTTAWENKEGVTVERPKSDIVRDTEFRAMLDLAGQHYQFKEGA